jgi:hypothetical protein
MRSGRRTVLCRLLCGGVKTPSGRPLKTAVRGEKSELRTRWTSSRAIACRSRS